MSAFTKGQKVRVKDCPLAHAFHDIEPEYYPAPGTVGKLLNPRSGFVEWPDNCGVMPDYCWYTDMETLEAVEGEE